jgi:hypothetical protein
VDNCESGKPLIDFTVRLAFRRDYTWGEFFGEKWTNVLDGNDEPDFTQVDSATNFQTFDLPDGNSVPTTFYQTQFDQGLWHISFPSGYSSTYQEIPKSVDHPVAGTPPFAL